VTTKLQRTWIRIEDERPKAADADEYGRVWAVAVDALNRPYPTESGWRHVRRGRPVYTHWMRPEWRKP